MEFSQENTMENELDCRLILENKIDISNINHKQNIDLINAEERTKIKLIKKIDYLNEKKLFNQNLKLINKNEKILQHNYGDEISEMNENSCLNFKSDFFYQTNENGRKIYNLENIIDYLQEIDNSYKSAKIVAYLLNEKKINILQAFLEKLGKDLFLSLLKQALKIENEGGLVKKEASHKILMEDINANILKKSPGGVLFFLFKLPENGIDKQFLRDIFRKDYKLYKEKKKLLKELDKMSI